jgi:hypothetical protein
MTTVQQELDAALLADAAYLDFTNIGKRSINRALDLSVRDAVARWWAAKATTSIT